MTEFTALTSSNTQSRQDCQQTRQEKTRQDCQQSRQEKPMLKRRRMDPLTTKTIQTTSAKTSARPQWGATLLQSRHHAKMVFLYALTQTSKWSW